jgi:very-short-patch-repair endonuclease
MRGAARRMRREPTDAESKMWWLLRDRRLVGFKFRRQVPFRNYVLDFVCFDRRIVVEVDGSQHGSKRDQIRDAALAAERFRVMRYWNNDVLQQPRAVLEDLLIKLES